MQGSHSVEAPLRWLSGCVAAQMVPILETFTWINTAMWCHVSRGNAGPFSTGSAAVIAVLSPCVSERAKVLLQLLDAVLTASAPGAVLPTTLLSLPVLMAADRPALVRRLAALLEEWWMETRISLKGVLAALACTQAAPGPHLAEGGSVGRPLLTAAAVLRLAILGSSSVVSPMPAQPVGCVPALSRLVDPGLVEAVTDSAGGEGTRSGGDRSGDVWRQAAAACLTDALFRAVCGPGLLSTCHAQPLGALLAAQRHFASGGVIHTPPPNPTNHTAQYRMPDACSLPSPLSLRSALELCKAEAQKEGVSGTLSSSARAAMTVSTGCAAVDVLLGGPVSLQRPSGLPPGFITEIYGEAGVGKTQVALSALASVASAGAGAVYLVAEDVPQRRLKEYIVGACESIEAAVVTALNRVFIRKVTDLRHLEEILAPSSMDAFAIQNNVRLIVVDSIAACALNSGGVPAAGDRKRTREWSGANGAAAVGAQLDGVSMALSHAATRLQCAVLVLNQVRANTSASEGFGGSGSAAVSGSGVVPSSNQGTSLPSGGPLTSSSGMKPALGLRWASAVNARYRLTKHSPNTEGSAGVGHASRSPAASLPPQPVRVLSVEFSPHTPSGASARFLVTTSALKPFSEDAY